ncbi:uncharacterized protein A1O9_00889 [Exophiala aquamarina CBS 119918]|uniref:Uncharacterized protein n=1 Tax=Exophiala aquamarina CBS 119918 TaxID=1182545 RepID=A0A072Q4S9_9EURO|nr:uncharacterized protein A1O9_00889 [Exophiala aquamarina CBS 119918]KEF62915.1 hypothetical protein A1O9_00889 [Exophiala aquamarina CBS 119918]
MDSMRSLNTSLPPSTSRPPPPEQLLQAFRTAALSVTNLYKSAVTDQSASRQAGYQDALEDLLSFLDRENLGLQDGEGWRVRQWATERYDGSAHQQQAESDDERGEIETRPRNNSISRAQSPEQVRTQSEPPRMESAVRPAAVDDTQPPPARNLASATPIFRFTGQSSSEEMQTDDNSITVDEPQSAPTNSEGPLRLEVINNRAVRTPTRHSGQRHSSKANGREFTFTAGTKRKLQFPDFFDISNIGPRDGAGGSKRGRLS